MTVDLVQQRNPRPLRNRTWRARSVDCRPVKPPRSFCVNKKVSALTSLVAQRQPVVPVMTGFDRKGEGASVGAVGREGVANAV